MLSYVFMKILEARPRSYDRRMARASGGHTRAVKEAVAAEVEGAGRVLEIGCGAGELALMLAARGARVEGFDASEAMVEVAAERAGEAGLADLVHVRHMGVEAMDGLPASGFDAVVSTLVLSELSDDARRYALRHALRVLIPGGLAVIGDEVVPPTASGRWLHAALRAPLQAATWLVSRASTRPIPDLAAEMTAAGFRVQREDRSAGGAFAVVVARRPEEATP